MRQTDNYLALVDQVIDITTAGAATDTLKLYRLLIARGFFIEMQNDSMYLSDNSHRRDQAFLDKLLKETGIGWMENNAIVLNGAVCPGKLKEFFKPVSGDGEAVIHCSMRSWKNFRRRIHGTKVAVPALDPFVARLVKAISSAGISTWCSCDGHGSNRVRVWLNGDYNANWLRMLLYSFIEERLNLSCRWDIQGETCTVSIRDGNILNLYLEIQAVADLLISSRVALRDIKRKTVLAIGLHCTGWSQELSKAFKSAYNDKFAKESLFQQIEKAEGLSNSHGIEVSMQQTALALCPSWLESPVSYFEGTVQEIKGHLPLFERRPFSARKPGG